MILNTILIQGQSARFYFGGKAGFGIPSLATGSISTPLNEDYSFRLSYYGGLVIEIESDKWLGFRSEINYSSQGGERVGMQALPLTNQTESTQLIRGL